MREKQRNNRPKLTKISLKIMTFRSDDFLCQYHLKFLYFFSSLFQFRELRERWKEFCAYLQENGEVFAAFLSTVQEVETEGKTLTLILDSPFYKEWITEETNKRSLMNIVNFYTDAPNGVRLEIGLKENLEDKSDVRDKLQKRYENLME